MPNQSIIQKVGDLSPDGSTKFYLLADILQQLYKNNQTIRILDVGGGSRYFQQQLKTAKLSYELTVIDIIPKTDDIKVPYIHADVTDNDLADNSFDVVLGTDVLEHVPEDRKEKFVRECLRIAKDVCIIAGPFMTNGVDKAEVIVNDFNKSLFGSGQDWLEEHLELGKPRLEMFYDILKEVNIPYDEFGSQNLVTWLLNTHTNLIDAKIGLDGSKHLSANRYYNAHIVAMNEFQAPTYRQFVIMYKDRTKQAQLDISRYIDNSIDGDAVAEYTSRIVALYTDRIKQLSAQTAELEKERLRLAEHAQRLDEMRVVNEQTIADQALTLNKLRPVLRVLRSKPAEVIKRAAGRGAREK